MSERFPDIEIYLLKVSIDQIHDWLCSFFTEVTEQSRSDKSASWTVDGMPVLYSVNSIKNFSCLWFKRNDTVWNTDLDCARAVHQALQCEVRCSGAGWQENDEGPGWIKLIRNEEKPLDWDN